MTADDQAILPFREASQTDWLALDRAVEALSGR
jgi:hypothetical protein